VSASDIGMVDPSEIFIDPAVMPEDWNRQQRRAWMAWARAALQRGEWTPVVSDRASNGGTRGPGGERYALIGFTENGQPRGFEPRGGASA